MKIVLVNPSENIGKFEDNTQPLGLGYIASVLMDKHDVSVVDAPVLMLDAGGTVNRVLKFNPDVVGITATTLSFNTAKYVAQKIKDYDKNIKTIIGGSHITAMPTETIMNDCFDIGIVGEGELTIKEIFKKKLSKVNGVVFKKNNKIIMTPKREFIEDLDTIPFPARHLFPSLKLYRPTPASFKNLPLGTMITSRGCPYHCIFCDRSVFGNYFRMRKPDNVAKEAEELVYRYGVKEIKFWDDALNIDCNRLMKICDYIKKFDVGWSCLGRINHMNQKLLEKMANSNCWQVAYGIESGCQRILDMAKKGITLDMTRKIVKMTKKVGIEVRGFFMLGLPGDTIRSMEKTINFAKSLDLDIVNFYIATPFPNTEFFNVAVKYGALSRESNNFDDYTPNFPNTVKFIPTGLRDKTIKQYQRIAYREFYFRVEFIMKKIFSRHFSLRRMLSSTQELMGFM
jgi:radical SAM superfamily enzyme YgiQ (UPF0313 family)